MVAQVGGTPEPIRVCSVAEIFRSKHLWSSRQWLVMACHGSSVLGFGASHGLVVGEVRNRCS